MSHGVEVRWADRGDVTRLLGDAGHADAFFTLYPRWLVKVGERNGAILGGGGVVWTHRGECVAFAMCRGQRFALPIHRAAREVLDVAMAEEERIVALQADLPTSKRWLMRLGFRPTEHEGVWEWQRSER